MRKVSMRVAKRVKQAKQYHSWLQQREAITALVVHRIDDYELESSGVHGQLYPVETRLDDRRKALWLTPEAAKQAAAWAARKYGHTYGIFMLRAIVEPAETPTKMTEV